MGEVSPVAMSCCKLFSNGEKRAALAPRSHGRRPAERSQPPLLRWGRMARLRAGGGGGARGAGAGGARDVEAGGELESLEAGTGVHLEDLRSAVPFEEVHAGDVEPEHARRANGGLRVRGREVDGHPLRAAVDVAAELALLRLPPHGADHALSH